MALFGWACRNGVYMLVTQHKGYGESPCGYGYNIEDPIERKTNCKHISCSLYSRFFSFLRFVCISNNQSFAGTSFVQCSFGWENLSSPCAMHLQLTHMSFICMLLSTVFYCIKYLVILTATYYYESLRLRSRNGHSSKTIVDNVI